MPDLRSRHADVAPYKTRDGTDIRELMHPKAHGNLAQSLAEATLRPGRQSRLHLHRRSEELYHVTAGCGWMRLGDSVFRIGVGDTVCIPPGTPHALHNDGDVPLRVLCCCAPAYDHDDTELLGSGFGPVSGAGSETVRE